MYNSDGNSSKTEFGLKEAHPPGEHDNQVDLKSSPSSKRQAYEIELTKRALEVNMIKSSVYKVPQQNIIHQSDFVQPGYLPAQRIQHGLEP